MLITGNPFEELSNKFNFKDKLMLPYTYIAKMQNKGTGIGLMSAFNHWLQIPEDKFRAVEEIVQLIHKAGLLLDDIQDGATLRRGIPVTHSVYGVPYTINTASYIFFVALEKTVQLNHPEAAQVYTEQVLEMHEGQGIEIYWRDIFQCPSEEEYQLMAIQKLGAQFGLVIRLMQLFSDNKTDFSKLYNMFSLYYQIRDDYCNLCSDEYSENKSFCEDITEGKFSFPVIHALRDKEGGNEVLNILRQRTQDVDVKRYCVSLLERLGSLQYTRDTLQTLDKELRAEVARLGGNPKLEALFDDVLSWREAHKRGVDVDVMY